MCHGLLQFPLSFLPFSLLGTGSANDNSSCPITRQCNDASIMVRTLFQHLLRIVATIEQKVQEVVARAIHKTNGGLLVVRLLGSKSHGKTRRDALSLTYICRYTKAHAKSLLNLPTHQATWSPPIASHSLRTAHPLQTHLPKGQLSTNLVPHLLLRPLTTKTILGKRSDVEAHQPR